MDGVGNTADGLADGDADLVVCPVDGGAVDVTGPLVAGAVVLAVGALVLVAGAVVLVVGGAVVVGGALMLAVGALVMVLPSGVLVTAVTGSAPRCGWPTTVTEHPAASARLQVTASRRPTRGAGDPRRRCRPHALAFPLRRRGLTTYAA